MGRYKERPQDRHGLLTTQPGKPRRCQTRRDKKVLKPLLSLHFYRDKKRRIFRGGTRDKRCDKTLAKSLKRKASLRDKLCGTRPCRPAVPPPFFLRKGRNGTGRGETGNEEGNCREEEERPSSRTTWGETGKWVARHSNACRRLPCPRYARAKTSRRSRHLSPSPTRRGVFVWLGIWPAHPRAWDRAGVARRIAPRNWRASAPASVGQVEARTRSSGQGQWQSPQRRASRSNAWRFRGSCRFTACG